MDGKLGNAIQESKSKRRTLVTRRTHLRLIAGVLLSAASFLSACKINKADETNDKAGAASPSADKPSDK